MRRFVFSILCGVVAIGAGCTKVPTQPGLVVEDVIVDGDVTIEVIETEPVAGVGGEVDAVVQDILTGVSAEVGALPVTLSATNFAFSPSTVTAEAGQDIVMTFVGVEGEHRFVIEELGIDEAVREGRVLSFAAPTTPGVYAFYCGVGSHHALGMQGTLLVK